MTKLKNSFYLLPLAFASMVLKGQDNISLFKKINNQNNIERTLKNQYYYNPASMSDYSSTSFSEFSVVYFQNEDKIYRQQFGSGDKGLKVKASSYQKFKKNRSIWGSASYQNTKTGIIKWNENLDYNRITPYSTADSLGGKLKIERYFFEGGFVQEKEKWTYSGKVSYLAQLGYRSKDPRLNSITSDLSINAGVNYKIYKSYKIGVFGEFNKYTQNNKLSFQSLLGRPFVYEMVGFGNSNNLFNGATSSSSTFEEFGYKGGLQLSNKEGKDFYLQASVGNSKNAKTSNAVTSSSYDTSDLINENYTIEGAKFFNIKNQHKIGLIAQFYNATKTGSEYGYSSNSSTSMSPIYKRKSYRKENLNATLKGYYQFQKDDFSIAVSPFYGFEEIKERRLYPNSGQKFTYNYFGISADYQKTITKTQIFTLQPYFSKRKVNKAIKAFNSVGNQSIDAFLLQDFIYQASDITSFGANARYDFKLEKLPAFFVSASLQSQNIQNENNNFVEFGAGITF